MRILAICLSLSLLALGAVAVAKQPAPEPASMPTPQGAAPPANNTFVSTADIDALIQKAKTERKPDQALFNQPTVVLSPYRLMVEYRGIPAPVSLHVREAEMFIILRGTATLVTGGTIVGEDLKNGNATGTSIEGGTSQEVKPGDIAFVPENTPHWLRNNSPDKVLVDLSFHVPRPVPSYAELEKLLP
jgi:mannose-6-phosphate isomerase-like protein (cupin superfamily)